MNIDGTISLKALQALAGSTAHKAGDIIPNPDCFEVGDVILHRDPRVAFGRRSIISKFQKLKGHSQPNATWSHVSMYVGSGMICESLPSIGRTKTGVAINDIFSRAMGTEIRILRLISLTDYDSEELALRMANYLLLASTKHKIPYGYGRLFKDVAKFKAPLIPDGVICSELILEALVFGAAALVDEYVLSDELGKIFLPADFSLSDKFSHIDTDYLEVI